MVDIKQIQKLLRYMGQEISVDGIWGKESETAMDAVLCQYEDVHENQNNTPDWWESIRYFRREEFRCSCGKCGGFPAEPQEKLVRLEDRVRDHFGVPIANSSGVRCPSHNRAVGGVANSRHLTGAAVDFTVPGHSPREVLSFVRQQPETAYCYQIDQNFVHMDVIT